MNKDSHSITQYIKDILSKYGHDAKPPNKHHPILFGSFASGPYLLKISLIY